MYVLFIVSLLLKYLSAHNERNVYSNTVEIGKKIRKNNVKQINSGVIWNCSKKNRRSCTLILIV